jgi:hypothetical protein
MQQTSRISGDKCAPISSLSPLELARALGGDPLGRDGVLAPGPGHGPCDRSLRVWIDPAAPDGFRVHSFADDNWIRCRDYVRDKLGVPVRQSQAQRTASVRLQARNTTAKDSQGAQREKARWLWQHSRSPSGTPCERYLAFRGIRLSQLPGTVRYLPPRPPKNPYAAMIAAFALAHEPEPGRITVAPNAIAGVHLTLLRADGQGKAGTGRDKIMVGPSMGMPIVLAPINDNLGLAITEGIEDALSVHLATGLGAWAAGSAARLPLLADAVPDCVDLVTIVADSDDVGQYYARLLAERLAQLGHAVDMQTPSDEARAAV